MKRRNLLKGLVGLPLLGLRGKTKEQPQPVKPVEPQFRTAMSFTVEEWAAPQHERDALEIEIQTLRKKR